MQQQEIAERQRQIIDAMRNPRTRRDALQKYDSTDLMDARVREAFRKRKEKIRKEMEKNSKNKVCEIAD